MDDTLCSLPPVAAQQTGWPLAGRLVDTVTRRDFDELAACLDPGVRLRAVLPRAVLDLRGSGPVAGKFRDWFGGTDGFEVLDGSAGVIGRRQYVRWRIRMWPPGRPDASRVVEQHAFTRGVERVESLDLLCSGFHPEHHDTGGVL